MTYDDHQWALLPLLLASMLVYLLLVATMFMRFRFRVMVYIGLLLYFHQDTAKDIGKLINLGISLVLKKNDPLP